MTASTMPGRPRPSARDGLGRPRALAVWAVSVLTVVVVFLGVAAALPSGANDPFSILTGLTGSLAAVSLAIVGSVLLTRLPRNRIGGLLWLGGSLLGLSFGMSSPGAGGLGGGVWLVWLSNLLWLPAVVVVGVMVPLLFPTGHLPSPRWRPVIAVVIVAVAASVAQAALSPFNPGSAPPGLVNPLAVGGTLADLLSLLGVASSLAAIVCFPIAAGSLVVRYRRASGMERAQLRWLATVAALLGGSFAVALATSLVTIGPLLAISSAAWELLLVGLAVMPVAIGIAVMRYRLYEIDRMISRGISYGLLTAVLAGVFAGAVLLSQAVLAPVTQSNELAVAASTLAVAALFQPLRDRVQRLVDRRFNRSRVDAERAASAFAGRLRDEVDLAQLGAEITATVSGTMQPISVALWLRA